MQGRAIAKSFVFPEPPFVRIIVKYRGRASSDICLTKDFILKAMDPANLIGGVVLRTIQILATEDQKKLRKGGRK